MALTNKPGSVVTSASGNELPDFRVSFPEEVLQRFPALRKTMQDLTQYHETVKRVMVRLFDEQGRSRTVIQQAVTAIEAAQAALVAQVSALVAEPAPVVDLTPILAALNSHIASNAAHGTTGDVVGTTDAQSLDSKTIGLDTPGHARFLSAPVRSMIPASQSVEIPAGYHSVVAGPFRVHGHLSVAGKLVVM